MGVWITWDADEVRRLLDRRSEADPVRATVLGTIRLALDTARVECWCAENRMVPPLRFVPIAATRGPRWGVAAERSG